MTDFIRSDDDHFYLGEVSDWSVLAPIQLRLHQFLSVVAQKATVDAQKPGLEAEFRALNGIPAAQHFPSGLYLRRSAGKFQAINLQLAAAPILPYSKSSAFVMQDPSFDLFQQFDDWWSAAESTSDKPPFKPGDWALLSFRNEFVQVVDVSFGQSGYSVDIDGGESGRSTVLPDDLVLLAGDPRRPETWRRQPPAKGAELLRTIAWAKLFYPLTNALYSFAATRTVFRPYQFLPALKMIKSQRGRILVADEVGLGKTIEAGLIWTELEQRQRLNKVLVIAPSSLTLKWRREMRQRFMRELEIFRVGDLEKYIESLDLNPERQLSAVISLEALRGRASIQDLIDASGIEFDLVIIDEAHAFRNKGTQGNRLAQIVADNSKFLALLSATPLNLGKQDLFNLMNLLEPHHYPDFQVFREQVEPNRHLLEARRKIMSGDSLGAVEELNEVKTLQFGAPVSLRPTFSKLVDLAKRNDLNFAEKAQVNSYVNELNTLSTSLNRTRKRDTKDFQATRRSENISVEWTESEWAFYEAIRIYFIEKARQSGFPRGFILQMPLRQTCSSIAVMARILRDKELLPSELLDEDEIFEFDEDEIAALGQAGNNVMIAVRAPNLDSKLEAFIGLMHRLRSEGLNQVLVFTFFRGTVNYLEEQLVEEGFSAKGIHGGIAPQDRFALIEDFRSGAFEVMVSNQVGAEGLDFEFCNVLVNYDLPWNPMQVEQRIGRLDRFGQKNEVIHIFNMVVPGTIESDIFLRLYDRIQIFENTIGDLEEILQERFESLPDLIVDPNLTPEELRERVDNVGISIELELQTKKNVEEERQHLSILDQLEVEGLSEAGPRKGRFMSPAEILGHLEFIASEFGAEVKVLSADLSVVEFRGSEPLASAVSRSKMLDVGTELGYALPTNLRSGVPLTFVLDSRVLSQENGPKGVTEIVSSRHPLVRMAQDLLLETRLLDGRFSDLEISGTGMTGQALAKWTIFESFGVDHKTEMWVTAIDLASGERSSEIEEYLMTTPEDLRGGRPRQSSLVSDSDIAILRSVEHARFQKEREERQLENEALVDARLEAERAVEERKLLVNEARLEQDLANGRPEKILQMARGKIDKSRMRLLDIEDEFAAKRTLSAQTHNVVLAKVTFSATSPTT